MDFRVDMNRLCRTLVHRGTHRALGHAPLGGFAAFLSVLFLVRIGANIYLLMDLRAAPMDTVQIAAAHGLILSAYIILIGTLAGLRVSFALPPLCFVRLSPGGGRFQARFIRRAALLRAMNLTVVASGLLLTVVLGWIGGEWGPLVTRALVLAAATCAGFPVVLSVSLRSVKSRREAQILEMLYLVLLVALNPDIGSVDGRVSMLPVSYTHLTLPTN